MGVAILESQWVDRSNSLYFTSNIAPDVASSRTAKIHFVRINNLIKVKSNCSRGFINYVKRFN